MTDHAIYNYIPHYRTKAKLEGDLLQEWEDFYNFSRPHGSLSGQTP
jgi:transposase InsO family protein